MKAIKDKIKDKLNERITNELEAAMETAADGLSNAGYGDVQIKGNNIIIKAGNQKIIFKGEIKWV